MLEAMLDAHLHVVDSATSGSDRTGHPDGAWWDTLDASPAAIADRVHQAGVGGGVLVQAVGAHGFDNTFVLESAAAMGEGWRAVVAIGGDEPDPAAALADAAIAGASGVRLFSIPEPDVRWLDREQGHTIVELCGQLDLTPVVCCLPGELGAAARLLSAFPDIASAIDHAGFVAVGGDEGDLASIAALDHVVLKLSTGVFDHSSLDPKGTIQRLLDLVGAHRLAWGSDHPQVRDRSYAELATLASAATFGLDEKIREAILEGTTRRLWFNRP